VSYAKGRQNDQERNTEKREKGNIILKKEGVSPKKVRKKEDGEKEAKKSQRLKKVETWSTPRK